MPIIRHSVPDSIPNFVEYNYPDFVELIELYYDIMFEKTGAKDLLDTHKYILADDSIDGYINKLQDELGIKIPIHESITNKSLITYYLNVILSKRGTEAAIKAFFKLSFNEDVIVNYPYKLLLISSITQHDTLNSCLLQSSVKPTGNYYTLQGFSSGVDASIEKISYFENNGTYYSYVEFHTTSTLKLDERVDLIGTDTITCINTGVHVPAIENAGKLFKTGDMISFTDCAVQGEFEVVQLLTDGISVNINNGGTGYSVGDVITSVPNNGFFAKVHTVDENGAIEEVNVTNKGERFTETPTLSVYNSKGNGANLTAFTEFGGGVSKLRVKQPAILPMSDTHKIYSSSGAMLDISLNRVPQTVHSNFVNNDHKTAINNFILDSSKTHNHSYKIITPLDIKYWKKYVDEYLHRSGYVYSHVNPITVSAKVNSRKISTVIEVINLPPITVKTSPPVNGKISSTVI